LSEARPRSLTLDELVEQTNSRLNASPDPIQLLRDSELLANALLRCHKTDLIDIHLVESVAVPQAGERPRAAPLSRWQAAHQEPVCNSQHRMVDLGDLDLLVLSLLDGKKDRRELCRAIVERIAQGQLALEHQGKPIEDPELIEQVVEASLPTSLNKLAGLMLLLE
jgi:methyltransferase-like protein